MANPTANVPVMAKKISNVVSVLVFMLRKGLSKRKLMFDLNMLMKRSKSKITRKSIHHRSSASNRQEEYEFSCSNSPAFKHKHHHNGSSRFFSCVHAPKTMDDDDVVQKVFDMLNNEAPSSAVYCFLQSPVVRDIVFSEFSSPALPGFGRTPMARQLRVTDSPFPVGDDEVDGHVDKAAEEFISKFYDNLRQENKLSPF